MPSQLRIPYIPVRYTMVKLLIFFLAHFSFAGVTIGSTFISAQHACGSYMPSYARRVREPLIMHATKFSNPKVDSYNLSEASHACWNEVTCFAHGKRDPRTLQAAMEAPPAHSLRTLRLPLCLVAWGAVACQTIGLRQEITVLLCIHLLRYLRDEVCRYHLHCTAVILGLLAAASYHLGGHLKLLPMWLQHTAASCHILWLRRQLQDRFRSELDAAIASTACKLCKPACIAWYQPLRLYRTVLQPLAVSPGTIGQTLDYPFWLGMWVMPLSLTESTHTHIYMMMPSGMI